MAIRISEIKSSKLSDDKLDVIVSASGKYVGDLELRIARECVDDLIDALVSARGSPDPSLNSEPVPHVVSAAAAERDESAGSHPNEIRVEVPKNFTVTAETGRGLVLLILNHRLENQEGYALTPAAAKQVAGGLTRSADALIAAKASPSTSLNEVDAHSE